MAEKLAPQGIDVELIDLRSLVPLDRKAILNSVGKTGRLVVVDEDYLSYGVSGEVVATVADVDPGLLVMPAQRVAVPDVPIPYAHDLEYAVLPRQDRIEKGHPRGDHSMSSLVLFPPLSKETPDAEGVLATWFVGEGSTVVEDQLLAEVQVDKVAAEIPAPTAGVVHLLVDEEAVVRQEAPIAQID